MRLKNIKTLALVSAAYISMGLPAAFAADNQTLTTTIKTSSVITVVTGDHMDFGKWLIGVPLTSSTPSTLVMNPQTGVITPTAGTGTQLIALTGGNTPAPGTVTVTLPTGADGVTLQMSHGTLGATLGTGLTLSNISYYNPDTPAQTGVMAPTTQYPITITSGATGVDVQFGGTITAASTPTDGAHTTTFNVAFAY